MDNDSKIISREQSITKLMSELQHGEASVKVESDWIPQEDILNEFASTRDTHVIQ